MHHCDSAWPQPVRQIDPGAAATGEAPYSYLRQVTQDVDDQAHCLTNWDQRYDQLSPGRFTGEVEEFCFGSVQLFREKLNQTVHQRGTSWPSSRTFVSPIVMEGPGWCCGQVQEKNTLLTLRGGDEMDWCSPRQIEMIGITADSASLNAHAQQVDHRDLEAELAGWYSIPLPQPKLQALNALLSTMMTSLQAAPMLLHHAHTRKALEQSMFSALLDTLPVQQPVARPSSRVRQYIVSRACEYMQAHLDEPISVADLCIELGVSRRTLQYSFQDIYGLNPVKFLRALRLNSVRRALKRAAASGKGTVTDIACEWGFWHLSYFSTEYKAMFGELPSETLRRHGRNKEPGANPI